MSFPGPENPVRKCRRSHGMDQQDPKERTTPHALHPGLHDPLASTPAKWGADLGHQQGPSPPQYLDRTSQWALQVCPRRMTSQF